MCAEPIILCNAGTQCTDVQLGSLSIHEFTDTTGAQQVRAAETSIFLIGSTVTMTDVWQGERQPQHTHEPGSLIFLPAGTEGQTAYASQPFSETLVRLPADLIERAADGVVSMDSLDLRYRIIPSKMTNGITVAVRRIALSGVGSPAMPLLIESMTTALAASIICSLSATAKTTIANLRPGLSERRKRMALEYIEAHLSRSITLAEIAGAAAMSHYHFARSFKVAMGVTPVRYVWQRRIELAQRMLRDASVPVAEVSFACGFGTQSHFTTAFREATGVTPAAYRRSAI